jgi:hypothetical protein
MNQYEVRHGYNDALCVHSTRMRVIVYFNGLNTQRVKTTRMSVTITLAREV